MGAALCQEDAEGQMRPVVLWSRKLSDTERKYSATEREALAIVYFVEKFRYYLLGRRFLIVTDHAPLLYILRGAVNNSKLARWSLRLQEFAFDVAHIKGPQNITADFLSRMLADSSPIDEWNTAPGGMYVREGKWGTDEELIIPRHRARVEDGVSEQIWALSPHDWVSPEASGSGLDIAALQRMDSECQIVMEAAQSASPEARRVVIERANQSPSWKRAVTRAFEEDRILGEDGLLWYLQDERDGEGFVRKTARRVMAPEVVRRIIMYDKHDAAWSGHLGVDKTRGRIKSSYWWPTMGVDVERWVARCQDCQRQEKGGRKAFGFLKPLSPVLRPFERMGMDLFKVVKKGLVNPTGFIYALVVTDYATRFAIVVPLRTKSAREVADALMRHIIAYFGPPDEILSDNGPEFKSVVQALSDMLGVKRSWSTPFHPRTNGLTERFNRTLKGMLKIMTDGEVVRWEENIPMIQYSYNSADQASVGTSPFYLMYGRHPRSPLELRLRVPRRYQEDVEAWAQQVAQAREKAVDSILKAQVEQEREFDARRRESPFNVGDHAWVRVEQVPRGANPKTFSSMRGPYRVVGVSEDGLTVSVSHMNRPEIVQVVHAERLQRAKVEPEEPLTDEERQILEEDQVVVAEPIDVLPIPMDKGKAEMVEDLPAVESDVESALGDQHKRQGVELGEPRLVVKKVWGHDNTGAGGLEYLVEWETERSPARGQWIRAADMDADELIDAYMTSFNMGRSGPPERWNQRCRANGEDYGCDHLRCRHGSWVRAMERMGHDVTQWTKKKSVKAVEEDSFRGSGVSRRSDSTMRVGRPNKWLNSPIRKKDPRK
jgi:transposase InsO family protein